MKKKEIVTLALTTALLMTAHAVPASAASNAPEYVANRFDTNHYSPMGKHQCCCPVYLNLWQADFCVGIHFTKKIDDIIRRYPLSGKESWEWLDTRHLMVD